MTNPNFIQKFVSSIVSQVTATVNNFAFNRLQEDGRFDAERVF